MANALRESNGLRVALHSELTLDSAEICLTENIEVCAAAPNASVILMR